MKSAMMIRNDEQRGANLECGTWSVITLLIIDVTVFLLIYFIDHSPLSTPRSGPAGLPPVETPSSSLPLELASLGLKLLLLLPFAIFGPLPVPLLLSCILPCSLS